MSINLDETEFKKIVEFTLGNAVSEPHISFRDAGESFWSKIFDTVVAQKDIIAPACAIYKQCYSQNVPTELRGASYEWLLNCVGLVRPLSANQKPKYFNRLSMFAH